MVEVRSRPIGLDSCTHVFGSGDSASVYMMVHPFRMSFDIFVPEIGLAKNSLDGLFDIEVGGEEVWRRSTGWRRYVELLRYLLNFSISNETQAVALVVQLTKSLSNDVS